MVIGSLRLCLNGKTAKGSEAFGMFSVQVESTSVGSGQVLWTCMGMNKTLPPSTSLPVMGGIAGVNTASLGGYLHSSKKRARWAEGFHDELNDHVFDMERNGLRQVFCPRLTM